MSMELVAEESSPLAPIDGPLTANYGAFIAKQGPAAAKGKNTAAPARPTTQQHSRDAHRRASLRPGSDLQAPQ